MVKRDESPVQDEDSLAETLSNVELTPGRTSTEAHGRVDGTPVSSANHSSASDTGLETSVRIVGFPPIRR